MDTATQNIPVTLDAFKLALSAATLVQMADKTPEAEQPIFIEDACQITGYAKNTIYGLISKSEIPVHKIPGRKKLYFFKSELIAWMKGENTKEVANA